MEFLFEYGLFAAKVITWVVAILIVVGFVVSMASKQKQRPGSLEFDSISETFDDLKHQAESVLLDKDQLKEKQKADKKAQKAKKAKKKDADAETDAKPNLFVINFVGSSMAKEVDSLRKEITAVLCVAQEGDEVLVNVESGGGVVHGYGLAASQLQRIKDKGLKLTISIDKVAASGGYMMACVADKIIAAPFAIVGSIGVIAQIPNFNKILKKNDIDFEMHTSGEFKRTLTLFGENTDDGRQKFRSELEEVHQMFKDFVSEHRKDIDIAKVSTGEYWYGTKAKALNLVDDIQTSDDFLLKANDTHKLYRLKYATKKTLAQKLGIAASEGVENVVTKVMNQAGRWHF
ncbi:protease SohB [Glaciecola sp. XM2]|uniref:protease SohB n=1 Tax=Glaciecola sp. XM2 TaxID=1914931 RepID=UPI001BDE35E0|nr:protease SohB [Glaciecola sp. XM2]MBT1451979.1 protease SohB [Glaciecola sp. XM2]